MATLICNGTGNLTGAATFATTETGALSLVLNRNSMRSLAAAASVTSVTFTISSGALNVIDAVLLWVRVAAASPTGTFKVDLQLAGVSQATCTVNKTDLPQFISGQAIGNLVPVLFKLGGTVAGSGVSTYTIVLTTTGTVAVNYAGATASDTNLTRALRTTTAATPAAGDDLYVIGELTGAGTHTARTVTMDSTVATAYGSGSVNSTTVAGGGIHVGYYGTLNYGNSASTNYVLRVNGDLWAWEQGTLNIGASGAEIPRNSTAVLEFQQTSADGDFGLRCMDNSVVNAAGLSRTSGKNVVQCKLTVDIGATNLTESTSASLTNATVIAGNALDLTGTSLLSSSLTDNTTSGNHQATFNTGGSVTNTTQVAQVFLARGTGTHNRFVRIQLGNSGGTMTNGFFADVDLQSGTIGTCTAVGNGTATSSSIVAVAGGYFCTITGKASSGAQTPLFGLLACSASTTISYSGDTTQCFSYQNPTVFTAASAPSSTFSVDTDTGWLSGDVVCIASTTRTAAECELDALASDAGSSSVVSTTPPWVPHSGTSPTQAEIGLLTRNVKIRSTSNTLMAYVYCAALATVNVSWVEFYYVGVSAGATNKRGIEIDAGATANAKSFTYCSVHDCDYGGFYCGNNTTSLNLTAANNIFWNSYSGNFVSINGRVDNDDWTLDSNLIMKTAGSGINLSDIGGTCTNNTVVATTIASIVFGELIVNGSNGTLGTFSGNTVHSSSNVALNITSNGLIGTVDNFTAYRGTAGNAISISASNTSGLVFNNPTLFGFPATSGHILLSNGDALNIVGGTIAGDTTFSSSRAIGPGANNVVLLNIVNLDMSGVGSIFAPHTFSELTLAGAITNVQGTMNNCKFGAPALYDSKSQWMPSSYIGFEKYNQTSGDHRVEMTYGQLKTDSTLYNTAAPSMRMTPNSASSKLESAPKSKGLLVAVASGGTVNVSVYVRKSAVGDGTAYNGNQPRLIQRANPALGQNTDVVLDTYSASTGSWNQLSATSSTATDDGAWEFIIDCDGTTGWINMDDFAVT